MRVIVKDGDHQVVYDERKSICVNSSKRLIRVFLDEIMYAESDVRKMKLFCKDEVIEYYCKIGELEKVLKEDSFVRCHKSYIVNMEYVKSYDAKTIVLLDGTVIPVSKSRSHDTKNRIIEFYGKPL